MRHALVIGGAGGIGSAVCEALAEAGNPLTIADRNGEAAAALAAALIAKGYAARGEACDAASAAVVGALMTRAEEAQGPVDVLVTMAGVIRNDLLVKVRTGISICRHPFEKHAERAAPFCPACARLWARRRDEFTRGRSSIAGRATPQRNGHEASHGRRRSRPRNTASRLLRGARLIDAGVPNRAEGISGEGRASHSDAASRRAARGRRLRALSGVRRSELHHRPGDHGMRRPKPRAALVRAPLLIFQFRHARLRVGQWFAIGEEIAQTLNQRFV